jgi:F-type H+-transporting ATPase subunit delta
MKYTVKQYAQSLYDVLQTTHPKHQDQVIDNFINILKTNGDLAAYEPIITELEKLFDIQKNTSQVTITTARDVNITPALLKELNKYSKDKIKTAQVTDEEILGGIVIRVDDTLIDASLRTELVNLKSKLKD